MKNQEVGERRVLSLVLDGTLQDMDPSTILRGLDLLTKLVRGFTDQPIKVAEFREGSLITGLLVPASVETDVHNGLAHLRISNSIPPNWTLKQVQHVRDLTKLESKAGVTAVSLSTSKGTDNVVLDQPLAKAIDSILKAVPISLGSVTGELFSYSARDGNLHARLRPVSETGPVKVNFTEELDADIRTGLRQTVSIYGMLTRHPETHVVEEIDAHRIRIVKAAGHQHSGRGIWKDIKQRGVTVDKLMKEIRGEDWVSNG
ncbi:hypothetical protein [Corynebacterium cystitidis]|uniref:hypothetical protein n=1 Tax=Corynebacterium cystitidis TaxID=35757 RepID=UPI00211E141A|nr:hypothetical protein [Corynebacterium cystitidis]